MRAPPFFSIGLTTYDRVDLLRQTLSSILDQTFADFELLIGNDNPARTLTLDGIGTHDPKVRIINQPRNLGQVGNWRSLLEHATGRYFTWIADDDLYAPDFLAACHTTLETYAFPLCAYTSFGTVPGEETMVPVPAFSGQSRLGSGLDLLWRYLLDEEQLHGNMGVFDREFLVNHTPWDAMARPGVALFQEYLFVFLAARLERVAYIPDPLIVCRDPAGSRESSNVEINDYYTAGKWLVRQCAKLLEEAGDPAIQEQLLMLVFNLALKQIVSKRKNASFPIDVDALFNEFLGLPETPASDLSETDSTRTGQAEARRIFVSLCRQYVVAETGRIEEETAINRMAQEAQRQSASVDLLTAETERVIEHLAMKAGERLRQPGERLQLIHRPNELLLVRNQIVSMQGPRIIDTQAALAQKDRAVAGTLAALTLLESALDEATAAGQITEQYMATGMRKTLRVSCMTPEIELKRKERVIRKLVVEVNAYRLIHALLSPKESLARLAAWLRPAGAPRRGIGNRHAPTAGKPRAVRKATAAGALRMEVELQEKEQVIQELAAAKASFRSAHLFLSPIESIGRLPTRLREAVRPRIGNLKQYAPVPLQHIAPYSGRTPSDKLPLISIVTPSYQQGAFIERTICSLLDQAYPNIEYVVQDGGSTDCTVSVLERYSSQLTHWESRPDSGQAQAINFGLAHTKGEIMAWLNSDDRLLPGALARVGDYFARHPEVEVVYGNRLLIDEDDREIGRWILPGHDGKVLSWADYVPQETLFWRRSVWERAGGKVDESFRFAMDWDLLIRFRDAGAQFAHIPRFIGAFRIHDLQKTSAEISDVGVMEMNRIRERIHGYVPSHEEISEVVRPFLKKHLVWDLAYRIRRWVRRVS